MFAGFLVFVLTWFACEIPPRYVENSGEVDAFLVRGAYRSACVGLQAQDADVRQYTAQKLVTYEHVRVVNDCLCEALYDGEAGTWNEAVAKGLAGSERDELAECLLPAVEDSRLEDDRLALVRALGAMEAGSAYDTLAEVAKSGASVEIRTAAARALRPSKQALPVLMKLLDGDEDSTIRAAAAEGLAGRRDKAARKALHKAIESDAEASVRAAAVRALERGRSAEDDDVLCEVLLDEQDDAVQAAIIAGWEGTKRKKNLDCIERRIRKGDLEGGARVAVLDTLASSPSKAAADLLCDQIGPWVRSYLRDKIFHDIPGSDIVKAQNDRDYERSYECVAKALRVSGQSCYGKNYLGHWMRELGGRAPTPWCPGMVRN